jgi:hypothetical protein
MQKLTNKVLRTLRVGDEVTIHFLHAGASDGARGEPFNVVIAQLSQDNGYDHIADERVEPAKMVWVKSAPMIQWDWRLLDESLHPAECIRTYSDGTEMKYDACHSHHISAIVKRAPLVAKAQVERNALWEQIDQCRLRNYMNWQRNLRDYANDPCPLNADRVQLAKREYKNPDSFYAYSARSEIVGANMPGKYNGNIVELAKLLIARKRNLVVRERISEERLMAAWIRQGRPGMVSTFRGDLTWSGQWRAKNRRWNDERDSLVKANENTKNWFINVKAFKKWVFANIDRIQLTSKEMLAMSIQAEIDDIEDYRREMDREFGDMSSIEDENRMIQDENDHFINNYESICDDIMYG